MLCHIPLEGWDACTGRSESIPGWENVLGWGIRELMENVESISFHKQSAERVNYPVIAVRWFSSRGPWEQK